MIDVLMRRETLTRTRVETVETISVTTGQRECVTSPKIELTGQAALDIGLSYGTFEGSGTLSGSAKVTAARKKCFTPVVTKFKKVKITEQCERLVMGQGFLPFNEVVIDEWEMDRFTDWQPVGRIEFEEEETAESNVTTQWVDPPGPGGTNTVLQLRSGALIPDFAWVDHMTIPVEVGTSRSSTEVLGHDVFLDGVRLVESAPIHVRGSGPLASGSHTLSLVALTSLGKFTFDLPVEVEPALSIRILEPVGSFLYDEQRTISVEIVNNESTGRNVSLYASASAGWSATIPTRVWIPASSRVDVQAHVHAAPPDESFATGRLTVSAASDGGGPATAGVDLLAHFSVQTLRVYERAIFQAGLMRQSQAPAIAAQTPSMQVAPTPRSTDCGPPEGVKATEKGAWARDRAAARESARAEARSAAKDSCRGGCAHPGGCSYLEKRISLVGPEERPDPQAPGSTQYRYECTSEGACQCEPGSSGGSTW